MSTRAKAIPYIEMRLLESATIDDIETMMAFEPTSWVDAAGDRILNTFLPGEVLAVVRMSDLERLIRIGDEVEQASGRYLRAAEHYAARHKEQGGDD